MIRARVLPLVFLVAAASVFAQQSATLDNSKNMGLQGTLGLAADCPLDMRATHGAGLPLAMNAGPALNHQPTIPHAATAQKIHLTLTNLLSREIVSAQFVIRGFSNKQRALSLEDSSGPDLAKTLEVFLNIKAKGDASRDLSLSRFTAVTSIDLYSITYADGSTWHTRAPQACSITPGLMMLVASTD